MMVNHQLAAKTYQDVQMTVSDRRRVLIMAFDGMIKFLHLAKEAMVKKEIEEAHNRLVKTKQVLYHLLNGLDVEKGGEIAENLRRLYLFLIEKITEANLKKDPKIVDDILPIFYNLCSAWEGMKPHTEGKAATGIGNTTREEKVPLPTGDYSKPKRFQAMG